MVIQHNISALNSHRNLGINNSATAKNLEKLSSGYRINRAGDDAAGLAISEKMRGQIRGLAMAEQNTENGISLIQTAEGGLNETHAILQRMRELSVQASNGTYQDDDRKQIAIEVQALKDEIDRIASSTHYNGIKLLDGSVGGKTLDDGTGVNAWTDNQDIILDAFGSVLGAKLNAGTAIITVDKAMVEELSLISGASTIEARLVISEVTYTDSNGDEYRTASIQIGDKTYELDNTLTYESEDGGKITLGNVTLADLKVDGSKSNAGVISNIELTIAAATGIATSAAGGLHQSEDAMVAGTKDELIFQIGANGGADQRVGLHVANMSTANLGNKDGLITNISIETRDLANKAIEVIDAATNQVSAQRASLGALQNRLEHTLNNLGVTKENLTAAESTIRDVDMAKEMMEFTKNNILVQASQAMLAQANALPQGVLSLLR